MKLVLCAVILAAMGTAGLAVGNAYRRRERLLAQLLREMQRLEEQVRMGRPLSQALSQRELTLFSKISGAIEGGDLPEAWKKICNSADGNDLLAAMESPERQVMDRFWDELGTLDRHSQLARFTETREALTGLHARAMEETLQRGRLYGSLGALLGLAVVVLLW